MLPSEKMTLRHSGACVLVACAIEEAAVIGADAELNASRRHAVQPSTAILLLSLEEPALLLLDAGGSSAMLVSRLKGAHMGVHVL